MKNLILGLLLVSTSAFSASVDEAAQLYADRDRDAAGIAKAQSAADMYGQLASEAADKTVKGTYLTAQSKAIYFVGSQNKDDDAKASIHNKGKNIAKTAMGLLAGNNALLAEATYQFGANLGKWGEAKGVTTSIGQWPTLKENMNNIIKKLKQPQVESYGAHRILGRAYYKIPKLLGGSKKKSHKYLKLAVAKTELTATKTSDKNRIVISSYAINNVYLAETLIKLKKKTEAKNLLTKFITFVETNGYEAYNADLVPETMDEIVNAKKILKDL